jgi:prepilin-type N-terminal cleavage/methylation domain-containing protein
MKPPPANPPAPAPASRRGFTLTEVSLTILIVGMSILGVVQLLAACTVQNRAAANATTAMFLGNNVQEAMADLPFADPSGSATFGLEEAGQPLVVWDDVDDFNGHTASPPMDATRRDIAELSNFRQQVTVQRVDPQKLSLDAAGTDAARVTVSVQQRGADGSWTELHRLTWVRVRR